MLRSLTRTALITVALALAGSSTAYAGRCEVPASLRSRLPVVGGITATNVSCSVGRDVARGIIRRYDAGSPISADIGAPQPTFAVRAARSPWRGRFTCRGRYLRLNSQGDLAYQLRCTQRTRVVRVLLYS
jgi:hypothetical protein